MHNPILIGLLFADKIITENNGKKGIIGTFSIFNGKKFPAVFPPWSLYAGFTNIEGNHEFAINLVKDDTDQVVLPLSGNFDSKSLDAVIELTFTIGGIVFPGPGVYNLVLSIDGKQVGARILTVLDATKGVKK